MKDKGKSKRIVGTGRLYQTFEMSSDKTTKYPGVDGVHVPSLQEVRRTCKFDNKSTVHVMVFVYVCSRRHQSVECKTRNGWGTTVLTVPSSNITSFMKPKTDPVSNTDDTHAVCDDPSASSSQHVSVDVSDLPLASSAATPATLADTSAADEGAHVGTQTHPDKPDMHATQPTAEHVSDQDVLRTPETDIMHSATSGAAHDVAGSTQLMGADIDAPAGLLNDESVDPVAVDTSVCPDVTPSDNKPHSTTSGVDAHAQCVGCASCTTNSMFTHSIPSCHI